MSSPFPKNFYWGAATSAHQIEGSIKNNWTEWEKEHARKASEFYKGGGMEKFNYPVGEVNIKEACEEENYISGKAADSFNRYKEDVAILKQLGLNAYRFSIDWSRIEPEKGKYSKEGLDYYRNLIKELKSNGIEPFLTCWHWPVPLWLEEEGGLLAKNIVEYFTKYVEVLVKEFGHDVKYWIPINEPVVISLCAYLNGMWPPQNKSVFKYLKICYFTLVKVHKEAYRVIKENNSEHMVGVAKNNQRVEGYGNSLWNKLLANIVKFFSNDWYLNKTREYLDFIGLNYYQDFEISGFGLRDEYEKRSDVGWGLKPYSIYYVLKDLKEKYDLPIIVTENGLADREDKYRKWWLDETVKAMEDAIKDGVDLFGYLHWSLLDNFEWAEGFWPKFGLVEVDRNTYERRIRKSGYYYRAIVEKYG